MDDFNTDDIIDEIISSPPRKRKEATNKESKSLESSSELRRSTKSVTFEDSKDWSDSKSKGNKEVAAAASGKAGDAGKSVKGGAPSSPKGRDVDFDDENLPPSGLDTPRSESSSIGFPDDSPRKTSSGGGGSGGASPANAPKMGFEMFTTSSTVSQELAPKAKKNDFDSFLGSLNSNTYSGGGSGAKDDGDDPLNSSGSAYQPWATTGAKMRRPATGDSDIESVLQSVDQTLKKRPMTAPVAKPTADAAERKPPKKVLSQLLMSDEDDEMFGTMPQARPKKKQQPKQRESVAPAATTQQPSPAPKSPTPERAAAQESATAGADDVAISAIPAAAAALEIDAEAMFTVKRPPTGRRARGGDDLAGLFDSNAGPSGDAAFSMPSIPLSTEMKMELESEIKKLRREKDDLKLQNEQLLQKSKEDAARMEASYKQQLLDTEELSKRKEDMLARENEQLKQKYTDTLRQLDQERINLRSEFNRQLDELAQEKRRDIEQLREQHRNDVEALRSAAPHAGALSNLVDRLSGLSDKLGALSDRESAYRLKDEVYRQTEVTDRQAMHEIVQSLKVRVDESARSERWLSDLATQLMEERRALTAERSELRVLKLTEGSRQADFEAERKALVEERARLQELDARLRHGRSEVLRQKSEMETLAEELKLKDEKLQDSQRSLEERLEIVSRREKALREQQARMEATVMEQADRAKRVDGIQARLAELRAKESEVSQATIQLAEERASLEKRAGGLLCANCRTPVRDGLAGPGALKVANSVDFVFARSRNWDDLEDEKLYLESLSHAPYG